MNNFKNMFYFLKKISLNTKFIYTLNAKSNTVFCIVLPLLAKNFQKIGGKY